jgi:Fe-S-cluster containining protein
MAAPTNCDGCGACCMYFMIRMQISKDTDASELRWYEMHGMEVRSNGVRMNVPCKNFDFATRRCKIYETRPKLCRDAKVGAPNCLAARLHMKSCGVKIDEKE